MGGEAGVSNPQADKFKNIFRVATVAMIPLTATMPAVRRKLLFIRSTVLFICVPD
jgi:hypothetical protein